ncbi:MAG: histidine phosphatase family protein [Patescibacteria group bacterium]
MGWPKLLVFVRHGESEGNLLSVDERTKYDCSSHIYSLTPTGRKQARITGEYLQKRFGAFDAYYTSYYSRTHETLKLMYPDAHAYEDPRLAEAQRGIWHVLTRDEVNRYFPGEIVRKDREGLYHHRPLGGENWPDIELRIHSFLGTLARDYGEKRVLIVGHGFWLILFQKLIHHFSIEEALARYQTPAVANASVTIYQRKKNYWLFGKSHLVLKEKNIVPWEGKI